MRCTWTDMLAITANTPLSCATGLSRNCQITLRICHNVTEYTQDWTSPPLCGGEPFSITEAAQADECFAHIANLLVTNHIIFCLLPY